MGIYTVLHTVRTWKECYELLNLLPTSNLRVVAWAITDLPEWARLKALRELRNKANQYREIIKHMSDIQINRDLNDPSSLFPCVFTREYGKTLLHAAIECYHCKDKFEEGDTMVWKSCGKHSTHIKCLRKLYCTYILK